ncbi:unnamed protein product [Rotaria sp. Silwood2]|nr:unnamed protein product [Rotaria sp. Silwood2]
MSLMLNDEVALGNDIRYKNYIVAIEKILKQFESSTEWPDLIANLVKVKKIIESYSRFKAIPKRITLSKRLAQCLHPALPSGVHLKALEVYETIFQIIDKCHLQRDIILYSYGLFSLLSDAALPVKPILLTLYETYFLPVGEALNPILTGFLIGLFSALEEGADYYNRVIILLDNLANRIDEFYFYTCIWSAIHFAPTVRYSAITFVLNHFDKRKNMKAQIYLIGLSNETMVSAICTCLHDSQQLLVQRLILDFLLTCLPMHRKLLTKTNMIKIINGTFHILLQRDMTLNRRIYTWFLGTNQLSDDITNEQNQVNDSFDSSSYFVTHTRDIFIESLKSSLKTISIKPILIIVKSDSDDNKPLTNMMDPLPSSTWTLTKLIRVLLILIDKPDVGPNIIESIFMNYSLLVYEQCYHSTNKSASINIQQENNYSETLKIFNILLDTLEPYFIWELLTKNFDIILNQQENNNSITAGSTIEQICGISDMLLDIFSLENSLDIQSEHLSEMLYRLIQIMNDNIEKLTSDQITLFVELLLKIFKNIISTNTNHHLSIFRCSITHQYETFDNHMTSYDSEDENDHKTFIENEYSTDIYNKLLRRDNISKLENPSLIVEQENLNDIEQLLRQMVHKVEKQLDKLNNPLFDKKQSRLSTKTMLELMNNIEKSIKLYQIFFHRFIITYLIDQNQILMNDKFQSIYSIIQNKTNDNLFTIFNRYQQVHEFQLKLSDNVDHYIATFENCCKLLTEFCCVPIQSSLNDESFLSKGKTNFDDWSMDICILALCISDHFSLQTIAISVLIELFGYTLSLNTSNKKNAIDILGNNLLIIPSFTQEQVLLLLNETEFFQYIIAYFWEYLSDKYGREYNLKASHILSILHSMLPNNLCEDLICNQLSLINIQQIEIDIKIMEEYKKFFKLWNSTRDIHHIKNENIAKSFQHCLIYVLRVLRESKDYCLKSIVQKWTSNCFIHGDVCRIFDILLIMLLHSDTARVSIQRFDPIVHKEFFLNQQTNTNEIRFSVISDDENSEDYDDEFIQDDETQEEEIDKDKQVRAVSCINPSESIDSIKSSPQTIKFPTISSLSQPILFNIRSFSPPTLLKSVKQRAPTISTIFNRNNIQIESSNNTIINSSSHSHPMPNSSIISESNLPQMMNNSIDFQYAYILIYTQPYDHNRIILSLNIIDSLFDLIPQQLIQTLLITSNIQSLPINIHNKQMHELVLKHRRSIEGKDYDLSNENNQEYQSYLYLLLNILLMFTYSYYPKCFDIQKNRTIHIRSLILLTRICHDLSYICMDNTMLINYITNLFKKLSFQKIVLCLFNRFINKESDLLKIKVIYDSNDELLHGQLTKEYLKQLLRLLEEIILLENIIYSTDLNLIDQLTVNQTIFLSTILQYLKRIYSIENHYYIISLVVKILPHCGSALKTIISRVIEQICRNLTFVVQCYSQPERKLEFNTVHNTQHFTPTLCPQNWIKRVKINTNDQSDARQSMLNKLPLILSSLLFIWKTISINQTNSIWLVKNIKLVREKIIEFMSSLTKSNGVSFLRAVVLCWSERKQQQKSSIIQRDNVNEIQALIDILMNINNYTTNDIMYNMNTLIRNLSATNNKKKQNYIVWCLQFLLTYLEQQKNVSIDCWSILAIMFKDCLSPSMSSSVTFLIIRILSIYVKQSLFTIEKRDLKDLQDIIMKVLENCNTIVASSLEQTNWLRKNLQVRIAQFEPGTQQITLDSSNEIDRSLTSENNSLDFDDNSQSMNFSLMALTILAEHAVKLLDIVYNLTDEKDRIIGPYLQNLVNNVMPYVRIHALSNAPCYRSASTLLMNISQYSYTKKTWKKEVFEQLFDIGFFQVDLLALNSWKIIIGNMIKDEKPTSFRDVMNRINAVQTGLLVSKEQEYEQRSVLIKRFAFIIYATEKDQCNRYLPDILECIADLLKLPQVPIVYTQIFLLFRALLIRISNKNLISFWPILMAELIQILLQLEQDLLFDIEGDIKSNVQRMTTNDITLTNISNGTTDSNPSLKMYLYACKLLDTLLAMPYSELCQFQLFRSAFVVDHDIINSNSNIDIFIAFSIRLCKLLEQKLQLMPISMCDQLLIISNSNYPLLRLRTISNIIELFPFFNCLARIHTKDNLYLKSEQILLLDTIH